ncbi:MAG: CHAT domain-containing protein [Actinomycetes bacterium]
MLRLALSRPKEAAEVAQACLSRKPDPLTASYALQTLSIAHREFGDGPQALRYVRRALRAAERSGRLDRSADVRATLGSTLALVGRTREALDAFDRSLAGARGLPAARIRMRRGGVLQIVGRYDDALADLRRAIPVLREAGDVVYHARALGFRALVYLDRGMYERADEDLATHERLMLEAGQRLESAEARHARGLAAYQAGDLPLALRHFDAAEQMYAEVGEQEAELELNRCRVLLSAGMPEDGRRHAARAVQTMEHNTAYAHRRAEALLMAASAGLAGAERDRPRIEADEAARLFRAQQRDRWMWRARRLSATARWMAGERSPALLRTAAQVADHLDDLHDPEATQARLLAGRIALAMDRREEADRHLAMAALARHRGTAISRATGWLAKALRAEQSHDARATLVACRRGLELLDEHRLTLGATEMRAQATVHGTELAAIATRHAIRTGDAKRLLRWSERWRATTLTAAPVRPPDDDALALELSALRQTTRRIADARADGEPTASLEREQTRLEAAVRSRMLRTSGSRQLVSEQLDHGRLVESLGGATLVELVDVDGVLHVVTVDARGTALHVAGPTDDAMSELEFARFGLQRLAAATTPALVRLGAGGLRGTAEALERALLGPVANRLGDGPVVVVPSGRLHAVPWSLLPSLRDREVTVAPSATAWLRARSTAPPRHGRVALVVGPGLSTNGAEVEKVATFHRDAQLLTGEHATADAVLASLDGATLAHVAAHGTFRADNALFSSLQLADGPLTVHDLERLRRPPHRLVLSSCDSGLGTTAGADELLGLSSALIGLGCAGLLASVVIVNDAATVTLMVAVHEGLRGGATLAAALLEARRAVGEDDPVLAATGQSFVALGGA